MVALRVLESQEPVLGLVIPAFNEESRIEPTLAQAVSTLDREFGNGYEVIVADDGSSDQTAAIAESFGVSALRLPHLGKGAAVRSGMLYSSAAYRAFMDADGSFGTEDVLRLVESVDRGADIAIATRQEHLANSHESRLRAMGSVLLSKLCEKIAPTGLHDTQCGAKAFRGNVADALFGQASINGFAADREVLYLARKNGYKVTEQPCLITPKSGSKVRPLNDGLQLVRDAIRIRAGN